MACSEWGLQQFLHSRASQGGIAVISLIEGSDETADDVPAFLDRKPALSVLHWSAFCPSPAGPNGFGEETGETNNGLDTWALKWRTNAPRPLKWPHSRVNDSIQKLALLTAPLPSLTGLSNVAPDAKGRDVVSRRDRARSRPPVHSPPSGGPFAIERT